MFTILAIMNHIKVTLESGELSSDIREWSYMFDYNIGEEDVGIVEIFKELDTIGIYYSTDSPMMRGDYFIMDLDNSNIIATLRENNGEFVIKLKNAIRLDKLNNFLD